jgi:hypothetical protein
LALIVAFIFQNGLAFAQPSASKNVRLVNFCGDFLEPNARPTRRIKLNPAEVDDVLVNEFQIFPNQEITVQFLDIKLIELDARLRQILEEMDAIRSDPNSSKMKALRMEHKKDAMVLMAVKEKKMELLGRSWEN